MLILLEILKYSLALFLLLLAGFIFAVGCVRIWFPKSWLKSGDIYFNKKTKEEEKETNF